METLTREEIEMCEIHVKVRLALESGEIVKPSCCEMCGCSGKKLDAHHHKGYEEAFVLDVQWICRGCHRKIMI